MRGPVGPETGLYVEDGAGTRGTRLPDRQCAARSLVTCAQGRPEPREPTARCSALTIDGHFGPVPSCRLECGGLRACTCRDSCVRSCRWTICRSLSQGKVLLEIPLQGRPPQAADIDTAHPGRGAGAGVLLRAWNEQASPDVFRYLSLRPRPIRVFLTSFRRRGALRRGRRLLHRVGLTGWRKEARAHPDFKHRAGAADERSTRSPPARKVFEQRR